MLARLLLLFHRLRHGCQWQKPLGELIGQRHETVMPVKRLGLIVEGVYEYGVNAQ